MEAFYRLADDDPGEDYSGFGSRGKNVTIKQKSRFPIGDIYFLARYFGACEVLLDSVKRLSRGCIPLHGGQKVAAECILKLLGFVPDLDLDTFLQCKEMMGLWVNGERQVV